MIVLLTKALLTERDRQLGQLPDFTGEKPLHALNYEDVLDAHFCIADFFSREGYGMGGIGIKDSGTFVSTVERQFTGYEGHLVYESVYEQIATLCFGIIKNHPSTTETREQHSYALCFNCIGLDALSKCRKKNSRT